MIRANHEASKGVLDHRANEIYSSLKPEDQDHCRRLFLASWVQPGDGTEDTKRRVPYRELLPSEPTPAEVVNRLIHTLADRDARLITDRGRRRGRRGRRGRPRGSDRVWTRPRDWVAREGEGQRTFHRLTEAASEWQQHGRD